MNGFLIEELDRELNMWRFNSNFVSTHNIEIIGFEKQYSTSDAIEMQVMIGDVLFNCGDLYITIYNIGTVSKQVVTQNGFFDQCFEKNNSALPVNGKFSEIISEPGNYEVIIQMVDDDGKNIISSSIEFTVK